MAKQTIESLVDGGKASAGPPLGPALGPMGVNIGEVIAAINEKTKDMAGMKVPVKVIIDTDTKGFDIEVGTPPISALIKKELGLQKASGEAGKQRIADLTIEQAKRIAKIKFGSDDESSVNQVKGTARSMGISVGEGTVTEEEKQAYEEAKAAEEAEKAEAEKPEVPEGEEAKEGEAPEGTPEEGEPPAEGEKKKEAKKEDNE
jgi:large subunit ribosomal protein L11